MANAARNGSGTFVRQYDWTDDAANSIPITPSRFDEEMDGVAAEITNSLALDGQSTMAAALAMGGFRITGLGAATADTDAPQAKQIQNNSLQYLGTTGGTSAAYTLTPSPAVAALTTGQKFDFVPNADNTLGSGETTLAISGLTATNIKVISSSGAKASPAAGDLKNGVPVTVKYDGTDFILQEYKQAAAVSSATTSAEGVVELATNAEVTTGTDTSRVPPVSSMVYHQGVGKGWVNFNGTGTVAMRDNYNVSSITDNGTGNYTINWSTNFANANYACTITAGSVSADTFQDRILAQAAGSIQLRTASHTPAAADATYVMAIAMGDR
jgi:hypothetical protein